MLNLKRISLNMWNIIHTVNMNGLGLYALTLTNTKDKMLMLKGKKQGK